MSLKARLSRKEILVAPGIYDGLTAVAGRSRPVSRRCI